MTRQESYPVGAIRSFLRAAFSAAELRRLCNDHPQFQPLRSQFRENSSLDDMIDEVVAFCDTRLLWDEFLAVAQKERPRQYAELEGLSPVTARRVAALPALPDLDVLPEPGPLPPGSRMPFARNAIFTGREEALKALARGLVPGGPGDGRPALVTQAIQGMGGVGKTQLAVEFAYRYGRFFRGVHWVSAAQPEQIGAEIAACGEEMGLGPWPDELPERVRRTLGAWREAGPRLVILDNLEDVVVAAEWWSKLESPGTRLVVTARLRRWPKELGLAPLQLHRFERWESVAFLREYLDTERAGDVELDRLAEQLHDLPLALRLAARYLDHRGDVSVVDYVAGLDSVFDDRAMNDWAAELGDLPAHDLSLARCFGRSWQQVTDEATRRVFLSAAWCAPNVAIPCEVLARAAGLDETGCAQALLVLDGLGLIELADWEAGPVVHPLVAEYGQGMEAAGFGALDAVAGALGSAGYEANETGLPARFAPLRAHVPAVAEAAEGAGLEAAGTLWNNLGYHLQHVADYAGARAAYERALRIDEAAFGPEHPNVATDVNNLGLVLQDLGDLAGARAAYERALGIWEKQLGPEHPQVATGVNNLGLVLHDLGDLAGARAAYERALRIDEAAFGPEHPNVAIRVNNLGSVLHDLGDLAGARAAFERALRLDEAALGPEHPNVATDVNNLGSVLQGLGDLAGARAAYERALVIDEAAFGPEHPEVATDVNNLGSVLHDLGDLAGARAAFERALAIKEKFLPAGHPSIQTSQTWLEWVLREMERG